LRSGSGDRTAILLSPSRSSLSERAQADSERVLAQMAAQDNLAYA